MKRIDHFFKICELPKGSQSSADAAEPIAVMEEADSSGSAVVVASNKSNECDDEGGHEGVVCQVENSRSIGNPSTTESNTESIMMTKRIKNASSALFARRLSQCKLLFQRRQGRKIHMQHLLLMVFRIGRRLWIAFRRMRGQSCTKPLF